MKPNKQEERFKYQWGNSNEKEAMILSIALLERVRRGDGIGAGDLKSVRLGERFV